MSIRAPFATLLAASLAFASASGSAEPPSAAALDPGTDVAAPHEATPGPVADDGSVADGGSSTGSAATVSAGAARPAPDGDWALATPKLTLTATNAVSAVSTTATPPAMSWRRRPSWRLVDPTGRPDPVCGGGGVGTLSSMPSTVRTGAAGVAPRTVRVR